MVVRSLDIHKDPFQPRENDDELLGDETPYLSAIETLMYLANNTRPNIYFAISLLARFSSSLQRDIGMESNMYSHIFKEPLI